MEDTIAAIATPPGEGGIGIIRISGTQAKAILEQLFHPAHPQQTTAHRALVYGTIQEPGTGEIVDEVLAVYMQAPHTYTVEDVAEIHCHGGMVPLRRTLTLVLAAGARLAEPGEFTRRAFLNGRLDLTQAEAVIDVIRAKTDRSFDVAMQQLTGAYSQRIRGIRERLVDLLVNVAVNIDYPDEDIEALTYDGIDRALREIRDALQALLDSASVGRVLQEGLAVSIIGKPNVGKSSLMNSLLGEARAIVTEIPGTTRDAIEAMLHVRGIPIRLTDTAGIRDTADRIEQMGIARSRDALRQADLVILLLDCSRPLEEADRMLLREIDPAKTIVARNKADLPHVWEAAEIAGLCGGARILETSMAQQTGLDAIADAIEEMVCGGTVAQRDSVMVTNVRHQQLLEQAARSIRDALDMTARREALEVIEIDVHSCYDDLGEIIGETVQDDIIDAVFSRFCLGK